jgi:hypothetical protein
MAQHLFDDNEFFIDTFNAIPFPLMVVDEDVSILSWNAAALKLLNNEEIYSQRGGDVLHCIHSMETIQGCGNSSFCKTCIIRNSVKKSILGGKVYREKTVMELKNGMSTKEIPFMVTTSPFNYKGRALALLILENIHELIQISSLLPICAKCKKIRTEDNQWYSVERYIKKYIIEIDFTHGLCPDCMKNVLPVNDEN